MSASRQTASRNTAFPSFCTTTTTSLPFSCLQSRPMLQNWAPVVHTDESATSLRWNLALGTSQTSLFRLAAMAGQARSEGKWCHGGIETDVQPYSPKYHMSETCLVVRLSFTNKTWSMQTAVPPTPIFTALASKLHGVTV